MCRTRANKRKQDSKLLELSIKCLGDNCPKIPQIQLLKLGWHFVYEGVKLLVGLINSELIYSHRLSVDTNLNTVAKAKMNPYYLKFKSQLAMKLEL